MKSTHALLPVFVLQLVALALLFLRDQSLQVCVTSSSLFPVWNTAPEVVSVEEKVQSPQATRDQEMEEIVQKFGQAFFDKSVSYSGTNHRLRRIIRRALAGESISIAILGGSITVGSNMPLMMTTHHTYHAVFYKWFQEIFPFANHSYYPSGIGGVGSNYFANCFLEHIPSAVDLVIIDSAVNDQRLDDQHRSYDILLRSLLTLPSAPAVISLEFFAISTTYPLVAGGGNQLDSSRYLDVPSLSLRNPLLPELLLHPSRIPTWFGRMPLSMAGEVDPRHPDVRGHFAAANILKYHVWQQILFVEAHNTEEDVALERLVVSRTGEVDEEREGSYDPKQPRTVEDFQRWQSDDSALEDDDWGFKHEETEVVPRMSLLDPFHPSSFIPTSAPRCRSLSGTREKLVLLSTTKGDRVENGTTYPGEGDGWFEWESSPQKQYIISRSPTAQATFSLTVGVGDVKLWYLMSSTFGLGSARCWIDDEEKLAVRFTGLWQYSHNIGRIGTVRTKLSPGDHLLHCMLDGNGEFRISSLITG